MPGSSVFGHGHSYETLSNPRPGAGSWWPWPTPACCVRPVRCMRPLSINGIVSLLPSVPSPVPGSSSRMSTAVGRRGATGHSEGAELETSYTPSHPGRRLWSGGGESKNAEASNRGEGRGRQERPGRIQEACFPRGRRRDFLKTEIRPCHFLVALP